MNKSESDMRWKMKIKLISDVYQKETVDVRIKTRVLQVILSMVVIALAFAIVKNIFFLHKVPLAVFETVLGLCTAAVIYFQYYGHYRSAWRFTLAFAFVIGIPVILQRAESSTLDVMYILFAASIIVILLSNFALNKIDFIITGPLFYAMVIVTVIVRGFNAIEGEESFKILLDLLYSAGVMFVLAHFLAVVSWYSNKRLVAELADREAQVKAKMKTMAEWVSSLSESMDISSQLNMSVENLTENLKKMGALTAESRENQGVVEENIEDISGFLTQIIEANEGVKARINNQAVAFEQTTAAIAQMSSSIENMSASASEKIEKLTAISNSAREGVNRLASSVQVFDGIIASINQMSEIVSVIEDISERTNLLAMNASIESVHAGEAGKGFSIVAQSIRNLSEETSKNSKIISEMIKKNIQDVKNAVVVNAESSENIKAIGEEIVNISSSLVEINQGLTELSQGTGEINKAVYHVADLKKEVDISTEKMSKIIDEEAAAVEDVKRAINVIGNGINAIDSGLNAVHEESNRLVEIGKSNEEALASLQEKTVNY